MTAEQSHLKAIHRVGKALVYNADGDILTLYRSETHPDFAHHVDFPGGVVEAGETIDSGVAREILEETGHDVQPAQLTIVQSGMSPDKNGDETHYYVIKVELSDTPKVKLSWEHGEYKWLSASDLLKEMAAQTGKTDKFWDYVKEHLARK